MKIGVHRPIAGFASGDGILLAPEVAHKLRAVLDLAGLSESEAEAGEAGLELREVLGVHLSEVFGEFAHAVAGAPGCQ